MRFLLGVTAGCAGRRFASAPQDDYLTTRTGARTGATGGLDLTVSIACAAGSQYARRRAEIASRRARFASLEVVRLTTPRQARHWLATLAEGR